MCGIFGIVFPHLPPNEGALRIAHQAIKWRGRDGEGFFQDDHCFLSHARLSIIDLESGAQPMTDSTGRYVTVFNGEIYNYLELKRELTQLGGIFKTNSDTEVLGVGLEIFGPTFFKRCEGMIASAIWDKKEKLLYLYRDPLGKKPLFTYTLPNNAGIAFSSTIESFKGLDGFSRDLNQTSILLFSQLGMIPSPYSIYNNVARHSEGSVSIICSLSLKTVENKVSTLDFSDSNLSNSEELIESEITRSLKIRLRSDVPLALTFSGGIDSGLLAGMVKELGLKATLFNIDYSPPNAPSQERDIARRVSKLLEFDLIEEDFKPEFFFPDLPNAYKFYDEPNNHFTIVYGRQLFQAMRNNGFKVALTGNGADELFFGYTPDYLIRRSGLIYKFLLGILPTIVLPSKAKGIRERGWGTLYKRIFSSSNASEIFNDTFAKTQYDSWTNSLIENFNNLNPHRYSDFAFHQKLFFDSVASNYLIPDISGLDSQIEVRAPFLDWNLISKAAQLKDSQRIGSLKNGLKNKYILKNLYKKRFGFELSQQPKRGMASGIRYDKWMRTEPKIIEIFEKSLNHLNSYGLNSNYFLTRYNNFRQFPDSGNADANQTVNGLMLSFWLIKTFEGQNALENLLSPLYGFKPT